jgi:hypothetical protein
MKALVAFVKRTIPKEYIFFRSKLQLAFVVRTQMWPTRTTKNLEEGVVWQFIKKKLKWSFHREHTSGSTVDEKTSSGEIITPKTKRKRCMCQKGKTTFNYVSMLTLN